MDISYLASNSITQDGVVHDSYIKAVLDENRKLSKELAETRKELEYLERMVGAEDSYFVAVNEALIVNCIQPATGDAKADVNRLLYYEQEVTKFFEEDRLKKIEEAIAFLKSEINNLKRRHVQ